MKTESIEQMVVDVVTTTTKEFGLIFNFENGINSELFTKKTNINSVILVNIIVALEDKILENTNKQIIIANDQAFSQLRSPFRTISSLINYTQELISKI